MLAGLLDRGDVALHADGEYRLTEAGRREAAHRFAEEFAPFLGQGHGECNDPECECRTSPGAAANAAFVVVGPDQAALDLHPSGATRSGAKALEERLTSC